jgi:hypothetical protein
MGGYTYRRNVGHTTCACARDPLAFEGDIEPALTRKHEARVHILHREWKAVKTIPRAELTLEVQVRRFGTGFDPLVQ